MNLIEPRVMAALERKDLSADHACRLRRSTHGMNATFISWVPLHIAAYQLVNVF